MPEAHLIKFEPDGLHVQVGDGVTLLEAAEHAGIILNASCGGHGVCGKCAVEITDTGETVRACQYRVERDLVVLVPQESRFFEQKILEEGIALESLVEPAVRKWAIEVPPPSLQDLASDARRVLDALHAAQGATRDDAAAPGELAESFSLAVLHSLPAALRDNDFRVTVVCRGSRIVAVEPGDTTHRLYGVGVDVGTTTVVASLLDLNTGRIVLTDSRTNPQVRFGDDVVSRIHHADTPDGLAQLQRAILGCLNELIDEMCEEAGITPQHVYELTAAGNATMQHILLGVPVRQIAQAPYVGVFSDAVATPAAPLGLHLNPEALVYVLPSVAGHVGGDTVAVALTTGLQRNHQKALALDIGTNGEILLANQSRILTCSTAAGPAFEGARISRGMRGAPGAIERVWLEGGQLRIEVIGGAKPMGICGSGLIDAVATLLDARLLDPSGRLRGADELGDDAPASLAERLVEHEKQKAFVLATPDETGNGKPLLLTQRDIREVQLGKAAIFAGAQTLLNEASLDWDSLEKVYLAGAFGNYIRPESARRIGLLGPVEIERIQPVGNAAGVGAREVLVSTSARNLAQKLAREIEYVELAGQGNFQDLFAESMFFPTA